MKYLLFIAACCITTPLFAEEAKAPEPTCGKTVEECQIAVDNLQHQNAQLRVAYKTVRDQRNKLREASDDNEINAALHELAVQEADVAAKKAAATAETPKK